MCVRVWVCVYVCIRFSSCILLLSPEYRLSLYPFRSLPLPPSSSGLADFFSSSRSRFPRNTGSRSLTLAWIACVNAYPMVNELAVISILESVSRRRAAAAARRRDPRRGCPCKDAGRDCPSTYPRLRIINE